MFGVERGEIRESLLHLCVTVRNSSFVANFRTPSLSFTSWFSKGLLTCASRERLLVLDHRLMKKPMISGCRKAIECNKNVVPVVDWLLYSVMNWQQYTLTVNNSANSFAIVSSGSPMPAWSQQHCDCSDAQWVTSRSSQTGRTVHHNGTIFRLQL